MPRLYSSDLTMFVYLKAHYVLEYHFGIRDARSSANEPPVPAAPSVLPLQPAGKRR
jgi:hypothetical protein